MNKKQQIRKKGLCLVLAGMMLFGSVPAGAEDFFGAEVPYETQKDFAPQGEQENEGTASEVPAEEWESGGGQSEESGFMDGEEQGAFGEWSDDGKGEETELSEEELREQLAPFESLRPLGFLEEPDSSLGSDPANTGAAVAANVLSRYDPRENVVTRAKAQGDYDVCWAFTTAAMMEASLKYQRLGEYDLSEEHLAYFLANRVNDPLGNTQGDKMLIKHGYRGGGNATLAALFLSTWSGMVDEKTVPYTATREADSYPSDELAYQSVAHLEDAVFSQYSQERVKELILSYGAAAVHMPMYTKYYNAKTYGYACTSSSSTVNPVNHAVTLVGWDDNYSKDNFPASAGVKSDGAWIAKNSWGENWGEKGFFYISYETENLQAIVSVKGKTGKSYPNNYFYDGTSDVSNLYLRPAEEERGTTGLASIFTANAGAEDGEVLGEIVLNTYSDDASFTIQVYTNLTDPKDPTSGIPAYSAPRTFFKPYAGIMTVKIPEVPLIQGTLYSVVVKNNGNNIIKYMVEKSVDHDWYASQADIEQGQSFGYIYNSAKQEFSWEDMANQKVYTNGPLCARIKAHTRTTDRPIDVPVPSDVTAAGRTTKGIDLSWKKASGVSGYEIYRKQGKESYKKLADVSEEQNSYADDTAVFGKTYSYRLRAYVIANGKKIYSEYSVSAEASTVLAVPKVFAKAYATPYNQVSWNKISGASGYYVYRRIVGEKWVKMAKITNASSVTWKDSSVKNLVNYQYTVRAYGYVDGKAVTGRYKASDRCQAAPAVQKISQLKQSSEWIRIYWESQTEADGYHVYRKTGSGKWEKMAVLSSQSAHSWTDKTAKKGKTYTYCVRAYVKNSTGKVLGKYKAYRAVTKK